MFLCEIFLSSTCLTLIGLWCNIRWCWFTYFAVLGLTSWILKEMLNMLSAKNRGGRLYIVNITTATITTSIITIIIMAIIITCARKRGRSVSIVSADRARPKSFPWTICSGFFPAWTITTLIWVIYWKQDGDFNHGSKIYFFCFKCIIKNVMKSDMFWLWLPKAPF